MYKQNKLHFDLLSQIGYSMLFIRYICHFLAANGEVFVKVFKDPLTHPGK
jgi:hypothetical protein